MPPGNNPIAVNKNNNNYYYYYIHFVVRSRFKSVNESLHNTVRGW